MQKYLPLIKRCAAVLVLIAIVCSLFVGVERIQAEKEYNVVNLSVNEADVRSLANGNGYTNEEMLAELKDRGVSQLLFKEATVASLKNAGQVVVTQGADVQNLSVYDKLPTDLPINAANYYVVVTDEAWREQVLENLVAKIHGAKAYDDGELGVVTVPTSIETTAANQASAAVSFSAVGVGFDKAWMQTCVDEGFGIIAQVSSWEKPTDASLKMLAEDIKSLPNLKMLMFNDKEIPGYPDKIDTFYEYLADEWGHLPAPLGQIEFNAQDGFNSLAQADDMNVVRLHTISNAEMSNFEGTTEDELEKGVDSAIDRLDLAVRERNMRALLLRFFSIDDPGAYLDTNLDYIESVTESIASHGFTVAGGDYESMPQVGASTPLRILIGLGICAGFLLLMLSLGFPKVGLASFVLSFAAFVGLYFLRPVLAMQAMALVSVIEFPIISCLHFLPPKKEMKLKDAFITLLGMMAISFIGAILMVGMMSDKIFMLKLSGFIGIKIAHVIPLIVVPFVIYILRADKPLATTKALLNKVLDYKWIIIFGVVGAALLIYVSRTGNDSGQISDFEMATRQFLNDYMGVRPRNKEFLIGYPATILYLLYGYKRPSLWVLTLPLIIGQISLVNTYAHLHTPLLISLQRSLNGLILGVVFALLAVLVVRLGIKLWHSIMQKLEASEA